MVVTVSIVTYEARDAIGRIVVAIDSVYADEEQAESRVERINNNPDQFPGMTADIETYGLSDVVEKARVFSSAKLTWDIVRIIRRRYRRGESVQALAREYDVGNHTIRQVIQGKTWKTRDYNPENVPRPHRALTEALVREARIRHANGESGPALATEYGVGRATLQHALSGRTWKHVE